MFQTKKKKISNYLAGKKAEELTAFDCILSDYISGELTRKLESFGMKKIEIHIDWLPEYKCIGIQGVTDTYWDIQIESAEILIADDKDEPDDTDFYPLENKEQAYNVIKYMIVSKK